jgi:hypothetical protein
VSVGREAVIEKRKASALSSKSCKGGRVPLARCRVARSASSGRESCKQGGDPCSNLLSHWGAEVEGKQGGLAWCHCSYGVGGREDDASGETAESDV